MAPTTVVKQVTYEDADAQRLRNQMVEEIGPRYADRESKTQPLPEGFYVKPQSVEFVALALLEGEPVGHILVRRLDNELEIKNFFVTPEVRGKNVASQLIHAAEAFAIQKQARRIILQTGDRQPEAVKFYFKQGYSRIAIYPPYTTMLYSNCFEKAF